MCKVKLLLVIFSLSCLIVAISAKNHQSGHGLRSKLSKWWHSRHSNTKGVRYHREMKKGSGKNIHINPGDVLVSSAKISSSVVVPLYRWYYALDSNHVISFLSPHAKVKVSPPPELFNIRDKYPGMKFQNRGKKQGHIGLAGILVGTLMALSRKDLPYDGTGCNGKHYVEYLATGKAQGKWHSIMHNKMEAKCPLWAPLTHQMATEIFKTHRFVLTDAKGGSITLEIKDWPDYVKKLFP